MYLDLFSRRRNDSDLPVFAYEDSFASVLEQSPCEVGIQSEDSEIKFALVVIVGTTLAVISALENSLIFYLFLSRPQFRISHLFYFSVLAGLDVLLSFSYILLMSVQAFMIYYESKGLADYWYWYLRVLFTLSLIWITASNYLIVAATWERFCTSVSLNNTEFTTRRRAAAVVAIVALAVACRGSTAAEFTVITRNCPNHLGYQAVQTSLVDNYWYRKLWMFYLRNLIVVICPFVLVAYMNVRIVRTLKRENPRGLRSALLFATVGEKVAKERKASVRAATRMLILVAFSYLFANVLNVVIVTWDNLDSHTLRNDYRFFFSISADIISLSKISSCAMRLPIYVWCNRGVRAEVRAFLLRIWHLLRLLFCERRRERVPIPIQTGAPDSPPPSPQANGHRKASPAFTRTLGHIRIRFLSGHETLL